MRWKKTVRNGLTAVGTLAMWAGCDPLVTAASSSTRGVLFSDGFESGDRSNAQNGVQWVGDSPNVTVTTQIARSGAHSLRFHYNGKADCGDTSGEQRYALGAEYRELWFEWWIYLPDGAEGLGSAPFVVRDQSMCGQGDTGTNMKFHAKWGAKYSGSFMATVNLDRSSNGPLILRMFWSQSTVNTAHSFPGFINLAADRGRWVQIREHIRASSAPGVKDGTWRFWKDGALMANIQNADIYPNSKGVQGYLQNGYLWGYANAGFSEDTRVYIDDVTFYEADPGW